MTRYTVVWHDDAQDELIRRWLAAAERELITGAADIIDWELARDAPIKGVTAKDDLRELVIPPLRVLFAVSEPDRLVKVTNVALV